MRIGNVTLDQGLLLAPMEDVTDQAFRTVCKRMGADVVYTEFVSAEAVARDVPAALSKMAFTEAERPFGIQIFGNRVDGMVRAAIAAAAYRPDILDINFGCPAKKIARGDSTSCAGSGLLRFPELMEELTQAVVDAMRPFGIPVTVKTRLGWDEETITVLDTIRRMERCGVAALTLHGRTREQMFKGNADWDWIRRAKEIAAIPIIGNGDVFEVDDVERMFDETGADAVMVGRGAIGNPWIFARAKDYLRTGAVPRQPTSEERAAVYLEHVGMAHALKGERGVREVRKHVRRYISGFPGASHLRAGIMQQTDPCAIRTLLAERFPEAAGQDDHRIAAPAPPTESKPALDSPVS